MTRDARRARRPPRRAPPPEFPQPPAPPAPALGFLLRRVYQRNMAIWQEMSPDPQFTAVQSAALRAIHDHGPCSLTTVGRIAAIDPATTRGVVDRLLRKRLISLQADPHDRRKVIASIAPAGRDLAAEMAPLLDRVSDRTVEALNPAERVALEFLLRKILAAETGPAERDASP